MGKTGSKYLCYKTTYGLSAGDDSSPSYLSSECTFHACLYSQECYLAAQVGHRCQEKCQCQEKALLQGFLLFCVMAAGRDTSMLRTMGVGEGLFAGSGMGDTAQESGSSSAGGDFLHLARDSELQCDRDDYSVNKGSDGGKQCFPIKRNNHQQEGRYSLLNYLRCCRGYSVSCSSRSTTVVGARCSAQ